MELTNYQPLTVGEIVNPSNWPLANCQLLDEMRYFSNKYSWLADEIREFSGQFLEPAKRLPTRLFQGYSEREILAAPFSELIERANALHETEFVHWTKPKVPSWNSIYDPAYKVMAVVFSILFIRGLWAVYPAQRKYLIAELVLITTLAAAGIISGDISFAASSPISTHIGTAMLLTYFPVKYVVMHVVRHGRFR